MFIIDNKNLSDELSKTKIQHYLSWTLYPQHLCRRGRREHHRCGQGGAEALPGTHASLLQPGEDCASHAAAHPSRQLSPPGQRPVGNLPDASDGRRERPGVALQQQRGAGAGVCWVCPDGDHVNDVIYVMEMRLGLVYYIRRVRVCWGFWKKNINCVDMGATWWYISQREGCGFDSNLGPFCMEFALWEEAGMQAHAEHAKTR